MIKFLCARLRAWPTLVAFQFLALSVAIPWDNASAERDPIVIGLDADMSSGAASGGESIRRGILLAIEEINKSKGVLGRKLTLKVKDHRGNPARGIDNLKSFATIENLVAVVGGVHTPVALAELPFVHKAKLLFLIPWAAGTPVVDNGYRPNFVFRVSVRDQFAGGFLIDRVLARGFKRPGLLLERTGWGRSNEKAMQAALRSRNMAEAPVQWFNWGVKNLSAAIRALAKSGADVVLLVANPREGVVAIRNMAGRPVAKRLPIVSHWGITGGDFFRLASPQVASVDLTFLQTYSFFDPPFPKKAKRVLKAYCARFGGCQSPADVISPVGTAHAYDLVHLLKRAIERAGTVERTKVRAAMERLGRYRGLVRIYDPPFTRKRHDALDQTDFRLSRFSETGSIVPLSIGAR